MVGSSGGSSSGSSSGSGGKKGKKGKKGNKGSSSSGDDEVKTILRNIYNEMKQSSNANKQQTAKSKEQELRAIDRELAQVEAEISSAKLASFVAPAGVAAGLAFGLGADNMAAGAMLTVGIDHAAEKVGARGADAVRSRMYDQAKAEGREDLGILREKIDIKQEINNVVTFKDLRDAGNIMRGRYNDTKEQRQKTIDNYKYMGESVDNI